MSIELPMTYMEMYIRQTGVSQTTLSKLTKIPQSKISVMAMRGERKVSIDGLMRIKKVLQFPGPPEQLLHKIIVQGLTNENHSSRTGI